MKLKHVILPILVFQILLSCNIIINGKETNDNTVAAHNVKYAGVRSSSYGIKPFPDPGGWQQAVNDIKNRFEGSAPCALWIVGVMQDDTKCRLEFPSDGQDDTAIVFLDYDKHEPFFQHFDTTGITVFLQVEPAHADISRLIDLVLNRYKHHPCIIGFGIDIEWYREADNPGWGVKVSDDTARVWEQRVKSHNPDYRLFLKHWDPAWMPPTYRGDLIFVDDSQMFKNFKEMMNEFTDDWANFFNPNTVFFQIGYPRDRTWWQQFDDPPREMGTALAQNISQDCGIFWVDFTLRDVLSVNK